MSTPPLSGNAFAAIRSAAVLSSAPLGSTPASCDTSHNQRCARSHEAEFADDGLFTTGSADAGPSVRAAEMAPAMSVLRLRGMVSLPGPRTSGPYLIPAATKAETHGKLFTPSCSEADAA